MVDIRAIRAHQRAFLDSIKQRKEPVAYDIEGITIKVNPGVFPPATDTRLLAANIRTKKGDRTLDLTSGAGSFSIIAGLQGASGIAVDINPAAVANSNENFLLQNLQMKANQSDLFANVPQEQYDYIFANGPFFEGKIEDPLDYACYGARKFIDKLFSGVKIRLKKDGRLLVVISAWSDVEHFKKTAQKNNLVVKLTATRKSNDGEREYKLYQAW
ncbi:MAG: methyltransferase [bacterium]|nr:methyltransferase [bacterium]